MKYFAYADNLSKKLMKERAPESTPMYRANLPGYKITFWGWNRQWKGGVATIKSATGERVPGAVYEVSDKDMRRLDLLEGYPSTASRIKVRVYDEDGTAIEVVTYIKTGQIEETQPGPDYLKILQQGYADWEIYRKTK